MSAHLSCSFDLTGLREKAVGTRHVMALGIRRAVQVAGEAGAVRARSDHPHKKRTGRLTSSKELRFELRRSDESESWGYLLNTTPYGAYVEYGTKPHRIWPQAAHGLIGPVRNGQNRRATGKGPHEHIVGRGIALRFRVGGQIVFARYVDHPGSRAFPFMAPAAEYAATVLAREIETHTFALVAQLWE